VARRSATHPVWTNVYAVAVAKAGGHSNWKLNLKFTHFNKKQYVVVIGDVYCEIDSGQRVTSRGASIAQVRKVAVYASVVTAAAADVSNDNISAINDSYNSMLTSTNGSVMPTSSSGDSYSVWTARMREVRQ